jgi:hypothetical protein
MEYTNNDEKHRIKFGIFSKILFTISIIFYFGVQINKNFNLIYSNIPMFTLAWMEFYRILTGIFISENIFDLVLNMIIILSIFNYNENKEGTTKFVIKFGINLIVFQIFNISIFAFIYWLFPVVISYTIKSLPSLGLAFLIKHLLLTENKFIVAYPEIKINDRWLLILISLLFFIFNINEFRIELFSGVYYGYLMCKFNNFLDNSIIDEENILHFEKNENYKFLFILDGWVLIEECYFNVKKQNELPRDVNIKNITHEQVDQCESNDHDQDHIDLSDLPDTNLIAKDNKEEVKLDIE